MHILDGSSGRADPRGGGPEAAPLPLMGWSGGPHHGYQAIRSRGISLGTSSFNDRIGSALKEAMSLQGLQLEQLPVISKKETERDEKVDSTGP